MKTYKSTDNTQLSTHFNSREFRADDWLLILLLLAFTMNNTDPEKSKWRNLTMTNKNRIAAIQNKLLDRVDSLDLDSMTIQEIAEVSDLARRISEIKTEDMLDVYKAISSVNSFSKPLVSNTAIREPVDIEEAKT